MSSLPDIVDLKCSVQRAMLGEVSDRLIALTAGQVGTTIRLVGYFSGTPTDDEKQCIWYVGGYVIGDFPSHYDIHEEIVSLKERPLEALDFWAFRRRMGQRQPRAVNGRIYSPQLLGNLYCSFQDALLDEVTTGLVQVTAGIIERRIDVLAYFNRPISDDDHQTFIDVAARVEACFPRGYSVRPRCLPWWDERRQPELSEYPEDSVFTVFAVKGS